jgi:LmbE family N-acetylglucosaminyl deacetylase
MESPQEPLAGHVVVISPHLDDAIFSLGATISRRTKSGAQVEVLTVFGCDPDSEAPANRWDTRGGFATEGEAATVRRNEDRAACRFVGATPRWLPFRGGGYTPHKDRDRISAAVEEAVSGADAVLVPGFPLLNADHAWLAELFWARPPRGPRLGRYAEQPYRFIARKEQRLSGDGWMKTSVALADRLCKRRAILAYSSQLPLLSFAARRYRKLNLMLLHETLHDGEAVSWP